MKQVFSELLQAYRLPASNQLELLGGGCPVPFFGRFDTARVATVGLNPSDREFMKSDGRELDGTDRRFPTLRSLDISDWSGADERHLFEIIDSCTHYFERNPYTAWFNKLDRILAASGHTYFGLCASACHIDLVPFATRIKWSALTRSVREVLLETSASLMGRLIRDSSIECCVLNGMTVVRVIEKLSETKLQARSVKKWRLRRGEADFAQGVAYSGEIDRLGGVALGRRVRILGYNHNIQSSFGVTNAVQKSIGEWISTQMISETLQ
jgi:hypothetical protein